MRKHLASIALAGAIAMAAQPAFAQTAQSDEGQVAIDGYVSPICVLGPPSRPLVDLGQMIETSGPRAGRIAPLPSETVTMPDSFCNFAGSVVSVEATALVEDVPGTPPGGFARAVNYRAVAENWAASTTSTVTAAMSDGSNPVSEATGSLQGAPHVADIDVTISEFAVPADSLLVAGNYSGVVRITLGPAAIAE